MTIESAHPLATWLKEHGEMPYQFAVRISVSPPTIYDLIKGVTTPTLETLRKIEQGTGGAITIRAIMDAMPTERSPT